MLGQQSTTGSTTELTAQFTANTYGGVVMYDSTTLSDTVALTSLSTAAAGAFGVNYVRYEVVGDTAIIALASTPLVLAPAPGADKVIVPLTCVSTISSSANPFSVGAFTALKVGANTISTGTSTVLTTNNLVESLYRTSTEAIIALRSSFVNQQLTYGLSTTPTSTGASVTLYISVTYCICDV